MASLWKREQSPYWFACYTGPRGERLKKSTKQTDRTKAMEVCLEWSRTSSLARQGGLTEAQARKVVSEIVEKTTGQKLVFHTAQQWLESWVEAKAQTKAIKTAVRYRQVVREFLAYLGARARLNIAHINSRDFLGFRDVELASGKSALTCNLALTIIGGAFNAARRQGFILSNPAEALEALPGKSPEKDTFTTEQIDALLASAPPDWKGAIIFAFYTGARLLDVATLRWDSIDLPGRVIRYTPAKTRRSGKVITIPIHPALENHLLELPSPDSGKAFVFPTLQKKSAKGSGGEHGLSSTFKRIMVKANVAGTIARRGKGKGRATSSLSFHSLRHSFNSAMANAGVSQELRQKLTGHASAEMNRIYTHHELDSLRGAVGVLPHVEHPRK